MEPEILLVPLPCLNVLFSTIFALCCFVLYFLVFSLPLALGPLSIWQLHVTEASNELANISALNHGLLATYSSFRRLLVENP